MQTYDIWFRPVFAFFIVDVNAKRVVQLSVTRAPTQAWTAQQLRNATPFGHGPQFIIRDRDDKFSAVFDRVATGAGMRVLRTAVQAPLMNSVCERFLGSVRRECLDHVIILSEAHLRHVLAEYALSYFNAARPHQGIGQQIPVPANAPEPGSPARSRRSPCSAGCTMTTARRHDDGGRREEPGQPGSGRDWTEAHIVCDNQSSHDTDDVLDWLEDHPRWTLHFTPKHASWLNQIECYFSVLQRRVLTRGSFASTDDLARAIKRYMVCTTTTPSPSTGPTVHHPGQQHRRNFGRPELI